MKPETQTLKNLFTAYAAAIEKVANELVHPHASGQISVPPEVIDYWLQHIDMVMEVDTLSLLGIVNFNQLGVRMMRNKPKQDQCESEIDRAVRHMKEAHVRLKNALGNLVFLHQCEQEGIGSGQPKPEEWIKAVQEAEEALNFRKDIL